MNWRAYAAGLRAEAQDVLEGRNKYPDPPEREAGPDVPEERGVLDVYEETLTGRIVSGEWGESRRDPGDPHDVSEEWEP